MDVLAGFAGGVDVPVVPVRPEVDESGVGVVDENPTDLDDVARDGDYGFLLRGLFDDAPVARS